MQENVSLKDKTTFKIGGKARFFEEVSSTQELLVLLKEYADIPFFILGEGSNTLISDKGFDGLVIKLKNNQIEINDNVLKVGAGTPLRDLVFKTRELGLSGLEWAVGIPGTVGAAVFGNAGAFNCAIGDIIEEVEIFDGKQIKIIKKQDCNFNYRNSIFKENNQIILSAIFKFEKSEDIDEKMKAYLSKRNNPKGFSIGSIFRNPEGTSAGKLIEACGLKGKTIGKAQISSEHANWIINLGDASSEDVLALIALAKEQVKQRFNIELVEEIRYL